MFTRFVYKPHWFVLAQTDGAEIQPVPIPTWDAARALSALDVIEVPFDATNGNVLGFARERSIAINPVNPMPHKTRFHELAHVLLGHTSEGTLNDGEVTPRNLRECEAEAVALLCWRRWTCRASSIAAATSNRGGVQAIRSRTLRPAHPEGGRSDPEGRAATQHRRRSREGRDLRPRLDGRSRAGEPAAGTSPLRRGPRLDGRRIR